MMQDRRTGPSLCTCPICGDSNSQEWMRAPDRFYGRTELYCLIRCGSCSVIWLNCPPIPGEMSQHYGSEYDEYIASVGEAAIERRWREPKRVLYEYKSSGAVLDLGCSSGGFLRSLKGPSWKLYGIEMSTASAERARTQTGAEIFVGEVLDAPYQPETFDAITCFHVLEHVHQPREVLERVRGWLKPGGVFITFLPNIDSAAARVFRSYWYALELPRHLFHFSPEALANLARLTGFTEASITTHRETFLELSARYLVDDFLRDVGISRLPLAESRPPRLPWRVARKAFRLTVLPLLNGAIAAAGPGEIIHAALRRPMFDSDEPHT